MATKFKMQNTAGVEKYGFCGFSWTSFFFGGIPVMLRRGNGIKFGLIYFAFVIVFVLATIGLTYILPEHANVIEKANRLIGIIINIVFGSIINKIYTKDLIKQGFVLIDDNPESVAQAKKCYGL